MMNAWRAGPGSGDAELTVLARGREGCQDGMETAPGGRRVTVFRCPRAMLVPSPIRVGVDVR